MKCNSWLLVEQAYAANARVIQAVDDMLDQLFEALMSFSSIGDMANSFLMRGHNTRIKSELMRLSDTLASGQHSDMSPPSFAENSPIWPRLNGQSAPLRRTAPPREKRQRCWKLRKYPSVQSKDLASNAAPR